MLSAVARTRGFSRIQRNQAEEPVSSAPEVELDQNKTSSQKNCTDLKNTRVARLFAMNNSFDSFVRHNGKVPWMLNIITPIGNLRRRFTNTDRTHLNYPKTILRSSWSAMLLRCYMVDKIRTVTSSWNFKRDSAWWNQELSLSQNKRYLDSREIALIARIST